jgi:hypothetical protein
MTESLAAGRVVGRSALLAEGDVPAFTLQRRLEDV